VRKVLHLRNPDLTRWGEIDDYDSLTAVLRYNLPGTWTLALPAACDAAQQLTDASGIIVSAVPDGSPGDTPPTVLFSGPVTDPVREWSNTADMLTVSGETDSAFLEDRLVLPCSPNGAGQYVAAAYDVFPGVGTAAVETVLRHYVDVSLGPGALPARRVPGLTLQPVDAGQGGQVVGRGRFDVLGDLLRSLATAGGAVGFMVVQVGAGLQFQVFTPTDRTRTAIFSPQLGNLSAFKYGVSRPTANYIIGGGGGDLTARTFAESGDSASIVRWGRRIERFRDRRDTTSTSEIQQSVTEELVKQAATSTLGITPLDTQAVQYLRDYGLGDLVTVIVDGAPIRDVVREVHLSMTPDGTVVAPVVGTQGSQDVLRIFDEVADLRTRIATLEKQK
jgi:hypothetical protein